MSDQLPRPPRDNLVRAVFPGAELRAAPDEDGDGTTLLGHFARFNEWTEIDSLWEGRFLERIAPGAFKKTFRESRDSIRVLFQHGRDPQIANKPLGPIRELREDDEGAYYEVDLLEAPYVRDDLLPGLKAGLYGASFRFRVIREEINEKPKRSDANPDGIAERTIKEAEVMEFGPVTFPAYAGATAGVRSLTDEFLIDRLAADPDRLRELIEARREQITPDEDRDETAAAETTNAPSERDAGAEPHLSDERRETPAKPKTAGRPIYGMSRKETRQPWLL